mmetsp:Transcript_28949/g.46423  ORF Transcript_28949/g.46423 Transcript_28949/m.46423 type:complete len:214 (+) Transcript_28949:1149-1790(+)
MSSSAEFLVYKSIPCSLSSLVCDLPYTVIVHGKTVANTTRRTEGKEPAPVLSIRWQPCGRRGMPMLRAPQRFFPPRRALCAQPPRPRRRHGSPPSPRRPPASSRLWLSARQRRMPARRSTSPSDIRQRRKHRAAAACLPPPWTAGLLPPPALPPAQLLQPLAPSRSSLALSCLRQPCGRRWTPPLHAWLLFAPPRTRTPLAVGVCQPPRWSAR